jgi:diaminopimelate epimerase
MLVNFAKMHGLGNDFVVIDLITQNVRLYSAHIRRIADRHLGIGCDQVILIEPPLHIDADFSYRIYNANGQEVEQCGNGARCAARFFYDSGYVPYGLLKADCLAGRIELKVEKEIVIVEMGKPSFFPKDIPVSISESQESYTIMLENSAIHFSAVSMGNPHAVLEVPNIDTAPVKKIGTFLSNHPFFPESTNVGFMQIVDPSNIKLRVFERGVGETLACGTGACAAAVIGIQKGFLKSPVTVLFSKGLLVVEWKGPDTPVYLTGPATSVFVGRFRL